MIRLFSDREITLKILYFSNQLVSMRANEKRWVLKKGWAWCSELELILCKQEILRSQETLTSSLTPIIIKRKGKERKIR